MKHFIIIALASFYTTLAMAQSNDKVDLKQIEDQFWSAKDTDFSVVQNRAYPKDKRFFINASFGTLVNDPFTSGQITRFGIGYFFSERWGLEIAHESVNATDNKATNNFKSNNNVFPNYNLLKGYQSASVTWVPFYAKMSFLDRKILYFDMQFSTGLGIKSYENFLQSGNNRQQSSLGFHFDVTQNIFFSKHLAFRIDLKNQWADQDLVISSNGNLIGRNRVNDTKLLFGLNIFY
jgi:outer membrane beta-barrel protein